MRQQLDRNAEASDERAAMNMEEEKRQIWPIKQRNLEQRVIAKTLQSVEVVPWTDVKSLAENENWSGRDLTDKPVLDYAPTLGEHGSLHFNLQIPYLESDMETRAFICHWSRVILQALASAPSKVMHYALSYWRRDGVPIGAHSHFGMIRASRSDVTQALAGKPDDEQFVHHLPGRYLSPARR